MKERGYLKLLEKAIKHNRSDLKTVGFDTWGASTYTLENLPDGTSIVRFDFNKNESVSESTTIMIYDPNAGGSGVLTISHDGNIVEVRNSGNESEVKAVAAGGYSLSLIHI